MTDKIRKALQERVVEPALRQQGKDEIGQVINVRYQDEKESKEVFNVPLVDVKVLESGGNNPRVFKKVPIMANGLNTSFDGTKIKKGDRVLISFYRNNVRFPYVSGRIFQNLELQEETQVEGGTLKSDAYGYF